MGSSAEQELRELVEERVAAVRAKDPAPLADRLDPDLIAFGVLPPLHSRGSATVANQTQAWFDALRERHRLRGARAAHDLRWRPRLLLVPVPRHGHAGRRWRGRHVGPRHALLPPHRRPLAHHARPRIRALRPGQRAGAPQPRTLTGTAGASVRSPDVFVEGSPRAIPTAPAVGWMQAFPTAPGSLATDESGRSEWRVGSRLLP
jgi:hypothetical protein